MKKQPSWCALLDKIMYYSLHPIKDQDSTHFNTLGGIRTDYLCKDGDWFYSDGVQWIYIDYVPICTPNGMVEVKNHSVINKPTQKRTYIPSSDNVYYPKGQRFD